MKKVTLLVVACILCVTSTGCLRNPVTPAGHVGYIKRGAIIGSESFYGTQEGPTSTGLSWMLYTTNVPVVPYTNSEHYDTVLTKDNLAISLNTHIVWKIKKADVKKFIEDFAPQDKLEKDDKAAGNPILNATYRNSLREQFRTFSRNEITKYDGLDLQHNLIKMGDDIKLEMEKHTKDSPFEVIQVVVGDLVYPDAVSKAVSNRLAATQKLEMAQTEAKQRIAEATGYAKAEIERAKGVAESNKIIGEGLKNNNEYLIYLWTKGLSERDNATIIYVPTNMGLPLLEAGRLAPKEK